MGKRCWVLFSMAGVLVLAGVWWQTKRSPLQYLTHERYSIDFQPAISPDGKRVAFVRFYSLALLSLPSSSAEVLDIPGLIFISHPAWSPDGKRLAFSAFHRHRNAPYESHIVVLELSTGQWECLTVGSENFVRPSWSPDGEKLLFTCVSPRETLMVWDSRSRKSRRLGQRGGRAGSWSPDGRHIVFVSGGDLWLTDPEGKQAQPILTTPAFYEDEPCWTPNGQFIVFTRQRLLHPDRRDLWALRLSDKRVFPLTKCPRGYWASSPCVQPDGKAILFTLGRDDHSLLCRLWVDWGRPRPVTPR
ncbi:MAG: hypothetical protein C4295_07375 [Candidatus Fervidibacterota bacterium]